MNDFKRSRRQRSVAGACESADAERLQALIAEVFALAEQQRIPTPLVGLLVREDQDLAAQVLGPQLPYALLWFDRSEIDEEMSDASQAANEHEEVAPDSDNFDREAGEYWRQVQNRMRTERSSGIVTVGGLRGVGFVRSVPVPNEPPEAGRITIQGTSK